MNGYYQVHDGTIYQVFESVMIEDKKRVKKLMAQCVKSDIKPKESFLINEANIQRNVKYKLWVKIENYELGASNKRTEQI